METFPVFVFVKLPCDTLGAHEFTFTAESEVGGAGAPFYLNIRDCYSFTLTPGEPSYEFSEKSGTEYDFCLNGGNVMPVRIQNTGEEMNNFTLSVQPDITSLEMSFIEIEAGDLKDVFITSMPEAGAYNITLSAVSGGDLVEQVLDLQLNVINCSEVPDEKTGLSAIAYIILIILALIVILIALYLLFDRVKDEESEYDELDEIEEVIEEDEYVEPSEKVYPWGNIILWAVLIAVIVALIIFVVKYFDSMSAWFLSILASILDFISIYSIYFIIGVVLAILIILYFWLRDTIRANWFWVIIGVVIIFLLLAVCFFTGVCKIFTVEPTKETNATNETVYVESSTVYIWKKNTQESIDLADFISNPDNDEITVRYTPLDNITVEINDYDVTLTPDKDWYGVTVINFIADDDRGGHAISPDITLVVLDEEATPFDPVFEFLGIYSTYILAGLFLAVIIVILLVLRVGVRKPKKVIVRRKK